MKLTVDRLIHAINNQLEGYTAEDALNILRTDYGFTDDEIRAMGFDYLFDLAEQNEPEEEPLKEFSFVYHAFMDTVVTVEAHNEEEAENLAEKECENICYVDMECYDSGLELITR